MTFLLFLLFSWNGERATAKTVPVSHTKIALEIQLPGGGLVRAHVFEGGMLRLSIEETGETYGITPVIEGESVYRIALFSITSTAGGEKIKIIESFVLNENELAAAPARKDWILGVTVTGSSTPLEPIFKSGHQALRSGDGICCVTCNGIKTCGCAVEHDCGSCCVEECCP